MTIEDILRMNVKELQEALQKAYKHIGELKEENTALRKQCGLMPDEETGC